MAGRACFRWLLRWLRRWLCTWLCTWLLASLLAGACAGAAAAPQESGLDSRQLAIVINDDDPDSVAVGAYYRRRRAIPAANVVHARILGRPQALDPERLRRLKDDIDSRLGPQVQAMLMLWSAPYKVDCHGITAGSAFSAARTTVG